MPTFALVALLLFAWGTLAEAQPPPPHYEAAAPPAAQVPLALDSNHDDMTLHLWQGKGALPDGRIVDRFAPLCTAPCVAMVPAGTAALGFSLPGRRPRLLPDLIEAHEPLDVTVRYVDRSLHRWIGVGLVGFGLGLDVGLVYALTPRDPAATLDTGGAVVLAVGGVLILASFVVGIYMMGLRTFVRTEARRSAAR